MRFLKEFFFAFSCYPKAWAFSSKHHLWRFYAIPALINCLIFLVIGFFAYHYSTQLIDFFQNQFGLEESAVWWKKGLNWLMIGIIRLLTFLLYLKLYRFLMLLLLSPALSMLTEKVQIILQEIPAPPFDFSQLLKDIRRGMTISLKNLLLELGLTLPLMLLGLFLSFLSPFTTVAIILIESYFVGFSMLDYRNEFNRLSVLESQVLIRQHKGFVVGNGLFFNFLLWIPIIGVLFAPVLAVVSANLGIEELEKK